ncbi:Hypothetical protein CINCED_3A016536 [Cinara cedri]|uniref:Uncharacterized protein n=1 Tax=Cinara cedri TaxID=506608 RepID=A0A5E4ND39_9HEMI|nr:Hypothetical protein CINCED_3A016536 [Cinara cedri]
MWATVYWVEYVPSCWIRRDGIEVVCTWPNNDSNLKKFRSNRIHPNKNDYTYYKCRVIPKDMASLSEAQIKAEKVQFTSDVSDVDKYNIKHKKKKTLNRSAFVQKKKSSLLSVSLTNVDEKGIILKKSHDRFILYDIDGASSESTTLIDDSDVDKDYVPMKKQDERDNDNGDKEVCNYSMDDIPSIRFSEGKNTTTAENLQNSVVGDSGHNSNNN